ncbi:DUF4364 family protein [Anaeropeptidivorans aminofermentans]|uniref:DUF4364 family protein n=1 Tax=Anaeropeptidivorans aminofermentans TaxID=2934315 RepID=UPI00202462A8|nr:DUF4364 family protein [Anaeropeptidivorans aminofermentans]MBE6013474.1 DUF4364 family protein [Lachnospiraceae bacterium]
MENQEYQQVKNKLLLMYLIDKMDIPLSSSQISQFALEENFMDYFTLRQCLAEMVENNQLESVRENNNTRYTITETGLQALDYFEKRIPLNIRNKINKYVLDNRKCIKKDYETTANYFKDIHAGDYTVKCGIYEDDALLMEINLSVVSREQAKLICSNWKANVNNLYGSILSKLITKPEAPANAEKAEDENTPSPSEDIINPMENNIN